MSQKNKMHSNIEIKARCADLAVTRSLAIKAGAVLAYEETQHDTYFRVPDGRLKLRRINSSSGKRAELIRYHRHDSANPRPSFYTLKTVRFPTITRCVQALLKGVEAEVMKHREVWRSRGVRIHLDEVEKLGTFVELEAVVDDIGDETEAYRRCRQMIDALAINQEDLLDRSYSDLAVPESD